MWLISSFLSGAFWLNVSDMLRILRFFSMSETWNCVAVAKRFLPVEQNYFSFYCTHTRARTHTHTHTHTHTQDLYHGCGSKYTALSVLFVTTCYSCVVSLIYTGEVSKFTSWHWVLLSWWGLCAFFSLSCRMQCILTWTVFFCILSSLVFTVHLIVWCCIIVWLNKSRITKMCVEKVECLL